jgi:hypothetical protein
MKITSIRSLLAVLFISVIVTGNVMAQSAASAAPAPSTKSLYEPGPHGGVLCPAHDDYKFEMVYNETAKKVDFYFIGPDNNAVEAGKLTGEVTFVNEDKSMSKLNATYEGKKFTAGVPDGKPLYMCGIVLTHGGQVFGGKFANPSMIK